MDQNGKALRKTVKTISSKKKLLPWLWSAAGILALVAIGLTVWLLMREPAKSETTAKDQQPAEDIKQAQDLKPPVLTTETVIDGLDHVWEIAFLPSGEMVLNQRNGKVSLQQNGQTKLLADIDDVIDKGEGGLLGLAIDPNFVSNRYIYTCFNSSKEGSDVRVVRWKLKADLSGLSDRKDIVTGMPANTSGRHSGCRLAFGSDGYLWVGTGDSATDGSIPQDPKSLGGKILRVDREGIAAADNPDLGAEFDKRIYSYGHRNTQGLAFFKSQVNGVWGFSVEHGPGTDDEVNPVVPGNFGWNPVPKYNEAVPMTDKQKYPHAVDAVWSSGSPTVAPSGAVLLYGNQWQAWNGALAVAMLKAKYLKVIQFNETNQAVTETEVLGDFGRLRTPVLGPDGNLYIGTDNGDNKDKIIKVIPVKAD